MIRGRESGKVTSKLESRNEISWILPTPKVKPLDRSGVHGWLFYYAAFSAQFVKSLLTSLKLGPDNLILDPFVGCGTTSVEAKSLGIPSVGVELNPTAYYVSRAKVSWEPNHEQLENALHAIKRRLPEVKASEEYRKWFHPRTQR